MDALRGRYSATDDRYSPQHCELSMPSLIQLLALRKSLVRSQSDRGWVIISNLPTALS